MELLKYINNKDNVIENISIDKLIDNRTVVIVKTYEEYASICKKIIKHMKNKYVREINALSCDNNNWNAYKENTCIHIELFQWSNQYNICYSPYSYYKNCEYTIVADVEQIEFE